MEVGSAPPAGVEDLAWRDLDRESRRIRRAVVEVATAPAADLIAVEVERTCPRLGPRRSAPLSPIHDSADINS